MQTLLSLLRACNNQSYEITCMHPFWTKEPVNVGHLAGHASSVHDTLAGLAQVKTWQITVRSFQKLSLTYNFVSHSSWTALAQLSADFDSDLKQNSDQPCPNVTPKTTCTYLTVWLAQTVGVLMQLASAAVQNAGEALPREQPNWNHIIPLEAPRPIQG